MYILPGNLIIKPRVKFSDASSLEGEEARARSRANSPHNKLTTLTLPALSDLIGGNYTNPTFYGKFAEQHRSRSCISNTSHRLDITILRIFYLICMWGKLLVTPLMNFENLFLHAGRAGREEGAELPLICRERSYDPRFCMEAQNIIYNRVI